MHPPQLPCPAHARPHQPSLHCLLALLSQNTHLTSCFNALPPVLAIPLTISVPPQGLYTLLRIDETRCAMEVPPAVQAAQRQASRLRTGMDSESSLKRRSGIPG